MNFPLAFLILLKFLNIISGEIYLPTSLNISNIKKYLLNKGRASYSTIVFYDLSNGHAKYLDVAISFATSHRNSNGVYVYVEKLAGHIKEPYGLQIVVMADFSDLPKFLSIGISGGAFRKYAFVFNSLTSSKGIEAAMRKVWKAQILNFNFIVISNSTIRDYIFNPFTNSIEASMNDLRTLQLKKFKNLYGYTFTAIMVHDPPRTVVLNGKFVGNHGKVLGELAKRMNATILIKVAKSYEEAHDLVRDGVGEMCFIGHFYGIYDDVTFGDPFKRDDIVVLTPRAEEMPQFLKLILIINPTVWFVLIVIFFMLIGTIYSIEREEFGEIFLTALAASLGYGTRLNFAKYKLFTRFSLAGWIFFGTVISYVYSSTLRGNLIGKRYFQEIDTLTDLRESALPICILEEFIEFVPLDLAPQIVKTSREKLINDIISANLNCTYAVMRSQAEGFIRYLRLKVGSGIYHVMQESLIPGFESIYFRNASPFIYRINNLLKRIDEAGLYFFSEKSRPGKKSIGYAKAMTLEQLITPFNIIFMGSSCSFIVFVGEIVLFKYH